MSSIVKTNRPEPAFPGLLAFEADARRATFLDQRMRWDLAESLRHIVENSQGLLKLPAQFDAFLAQLEARPVSPLTFSFYCDAVLAIEEDDLDEAAHLLDGMVNLPLPANDTAIIDLGDPETDVIAQRFVRFIDTDPTLEFKVFPPSRASSENCRALIARAFALLDAGDAELAKEIRALLRAIVLAEGSKDPKALTFDGASSFMLWGGIIVNAGRFESDLTMVQMLAHESTHNLLFGLTADTALVENSDDELYSSPLRLDPRPMDGIYHATFVSARMYRVVHRLLESGVLNPGQHAQAQKELLENRRLYENGIQVVRAHGKLTPTGRAIMQGAEAYMAAH